jgi:hypothetical protein
MTSAQITDDRDTEPQFNLVQLRVEAGGVESHITTLPSQQSIQSVSDHTIKSKEPWFLSQQPWTIRHLTPEQAPQSFGIETLEAYMTIVHKWLRDWIADGHSALFHRHLYRMHMPRCIQDVYTGLAAYLGKTPDTEATVRRIFEARLNQLVDDSTFEVALSLGILTPVDHVARVQALLIYQVICLFDGNIRLRAQAERHLPVLLSWRDQMWGRITDGISTGDPISVFAGIGERDPSLDQWRAWIFLESVRRTWLTCAILHGVYMTMKEGYSECPGGLHCTFGNGLWDAKSAHQWRNVIRGKDTLFMQSLELDELFLKTEPSRIDEFGHAIMLISCGLERIESWKAVEG